MNQLESLNAREREFLHSEEEKDSVWIASLMACGKPDVVCEEDGDHDKEDRVESHETDQNIAYLEDMRKRLQDMYEKYNELQVESILPADVLPKSESVLSTTYSTPTSRSHSKQSTPVSSSRKRFFGI